MNASEGRKVFRASIRSSQYYSHLYNRFYPEPHVRTLPTPENSAHRHPPLRRVLQDLTASPPLQSDTYSVEDSDDETPPLQPVSLRRLSAMVSSNHAQCPAPIGVSVPEGSVNAAASHISISDSDDEADREAPRYGPPVLILVWTKVHLNYFVRCCMRTAGSHYAFRAILDLLSFYLLRKKVLHSPSQTSNHSYDGLGFKTPMNSNFLTPDSAFGFLWDGIIVLHTFRLQTSCF